MDAPRATTLQRMLHVLKGRVVCCHCGHWSKPVWRGTGRYRRQIWYCKSCGALLRPVLGSGLVDLVILVFLFFLSFPLLVFIGPVFFPKPPAWFFIVVTALGASLAGVGLIYVRSTILSRSMTQTVGPHGHCFNCGYNLNYSVSDRCSECGVPVADVREAIVKWNKHGKRAVVD